MANIQTNPLWQGDWYLQNEGRGLLTLISEPDFKLKDVLPNWQGDGHFWWFIDHNQLDRYVYLDLDVIGKVLFTSLNFTDKEHAVRF